MTIDQLPPFIRNNFEVHEWRHACAVLQNDFPGEWKDICALLRQFKLPKSLIITAGGRKSAIADGLDTFLVSKGWREKGFETKIVVDGNEIDSPTHKVDCFKNGIAVEIEWNNKDTFFDRDLNNFRLLFDLRVISAGIIITRSSELQSLFDELERGSSYGASTTHMGRLIPKINGGGGGGCPLLVFGIKRSLYMEDS